MKIHDLRGEKPKGKSKDGMMPVDADGPHVHMSDAHMGRMNGMQMPEVGQEYEIHGRAVVKGKNESADGKGKSRSMHMEITHLGMSKRKGEDKSLRETLEEAAEKDNPKEEAAEHGKK